jgi:putative glycosyltransferase (TIGR04348 family)
MPNPTALRTDCERRARIVIVTPYLSDANNGNWRTAERWRSMLSPRFETIVQNDWHGAARSPCDLLIALHARRSHAAIARFRRAHPAKPLIVTLTGTDLYGDLAAQPPDNDALESLRWADALIVLQEDAIRHLPKAQRSKAHAIYQSCPRPQPAARPKDRLQCVVVGHLRGEKSPRTIFEAVRLLERDRGIFIDHIGAGLDRTLEREANALARTHANYRYLGALPHTDTLEAIGAAHLLIHPSLMEGGANVVAEAIVSGTPVLASRMSGNIGMLGRDYNGYFPVNNARRLASALRRIARDPSVLIELRKHTNLRRRLFSPERERKALNVLVDSVMQATNGVPR